MTLQYYIHARQTIILRDMTGRSGVRAQYSVEPSTCEPVPLTAGLSGRRRREGR